MASCKTNFLCTLMTTYLSKFCSGSPITGRTWSSKYGRTSAAAIPRKRKCDWHLLVSYYATHRWNDLKRYGMIMHQVLSWISKCHRQCLKIDVLVTKFTFHGDSYLICSDKICRGFLLTLLQFLFSCMSCMEKYFQNSLVMIGLETFMTCFCSFTIVHRT